MASELGTRCMLTQSFLNATFFFTLSYTSLHSLYPYDLLFESHPPYNCPSLLASLHALGKHCGQAFRDCLSSSWFSGSDTSAHLLHEHVLPFVGILLGLVYNGVRRKRKSFTLVS